MASNLIRFPTTPETIMSAHDITDNLSTEQSSRQAADKKRSLAAATIKISKMERGRSFIGHRLLLPRNIIAAIESSYQAFQAIRNRVTIETDTRLNDELFFRKYLLEIIKRLLINFIVRLIRNTLKLQAKYLARKVSFKRKYQVPNG